MSKKIILLLILSSVLLSSCSIIEDWIEQFLTDKITEAVMADKDPPPGYDPKFISTIETIESDEIDNASVEISRIDNSDPNNIKMYVHLIKDDQIYLTGAANGPLSDIWCAVYDTTAGGVTSSKKLKVTEITENSTPPLSTAIVMDLSGSMGDPRAKRMQEGVRDFISKKKQDDRIGLVRYDNKIDKQLYPTSDRSKLMNEHQITGLQGFGGGTETLNAIEAGLEILGTEEDNRYKSIIVFTDGKSSYPQDRMDKIAKKARANDVIINTIDYGYNIVEGKLEYIAEATNGIYHHIYTQDEFEPMFNDMYNRLSYSYVIEYSPESFGKHNIGLELCLKDRKILASSDFDNTPKAGDIALLDINFDTNKSELKDSEVGKLQNLLTLMKSQSDIKIELQGHTDDRGDDELNQKLSQARADAVKAYLIKNGIATDRIRSVGFGETMPIASNETEAGRAKNRRTQFQVIE